MKKWKNIKIISMLVCLSFLLPINVVLADGDSDGDGWTDSEETTVYYTNPYDPDTDHDGVNDPQDIDPLVDLEVTVTVKRVYASEYTYTWREGESWDRSEGKSSDFQSHEVPQGPSAGSSIVQQGHPVPLSGGVDRGRSLMIQMHRMDGVPDRIIE